MTTRTTAPTAKKIAWRVEVVRRRAGDVVLRGDPDRGERDRRQPERREDEQRVQREAQDAAQRGRDGGGSLDGVHRVLDSPRTNFFSTPKCWERMSRVIGAAASAPKQPHSSTVVATTIGLRPRPPGT